MDQTHIGYTFWNEPPLNAMPAVEQVQPLPGAHMLVFPEASTPFRPALPVFDSANNQTRTIDLSNRGSDPYSFTATASASWVHLSATSGTVSADMPLTVSIDWRQLPTADAKATILVTQQGANSSPPVTIAVEAMRPAEPLTGFVENNGIVSIQAEHFTAKHDSNGSSWQLLPNYGETLSAMEAVPVNAPSDPAAHACLEYRVNLSTAGPHTVQAILAPTSSFVPGRGLRYALALDSQPPHSRRCMGFQHDARLGAGRQRRRPQGIYPYQRRCPRPAHAARLHGRPRRRPREARHHSHPTRLAALLAGTHGVPRPTRERNRQSQLIEPDAASFLHAPKRIRRSTEKDLPCRLGLHFARLV